MISWHDNTNCIIIYTMQLHFIAGTGDFKISSYIDPSLQGSILDVASSPNDPLFILHHTAVDCVFEE